MPSRRGDDAHPSPDARWGEPEQVLCGRTLLGGRVVPIEIGIDGDGTIVRVGRTVPGPERHDFGDRFLLPSATDLHAHFRDPGPPGAEESFLTGTAQAALGGVGVVVDMPNTVPPVDDLEHLEEKIARTRGRLHVDAILFASAARADRIPALGRAAGGFKLYLSPTTGIEEPPTIAEVPAILEAVASTGLALSVHAESPDRFPTGRIPRTPADWNAARPPPSELAAVNALLPAPPALRLHVAHVTQGSVADRLAAVGGSFEATVHHLLLNENSGRDARFKVNPPLRSEAERHGLWERFRRGLVPIVASDHAPHPIADKERPFDRAPSGMPGIETMLPLLFAHTRAGDLGLDVLLRAAADRPARWLGVPHGRISIGHRANLLVVDFTARRTITDDELHAPCGWTAFEGREAIFPTHHYRDGELIVEDGELTGRPRGRLVRPDYAR